jgi:Mn-dependent DtxR family transcriptional regulator
LCRTQIAERLSVPASTVSGIITRSKLRAKGDGNRTRYDGIAPTKVVRAKI